MNRQDAKLGMKVKLNDVENANRFPGVWTIKKINPSNLKLEQNGRTLSAPPYLVDECTGDEPTVAAAADQISAPVFAGQVVTLTGKPNQLFVVIKDNVDKVNVALLGGDQGRYWRVARRNVTVVTIEAKVLVNA
jgi:hypothetical protein